MRMRIQEIVRNFPSSWIGQGFGFKSLKNYENFADAICYIPEGSYTSDLFEQGEVYTRQDFIRLAKDFIERNEIDLSDLGLSVEEIARDLFDSCDWQCPETEIDQWELMGTFTKDEE